MSTDPLGLKAGINDYCFVLGNPVTRVDVDGRREFVFRTPTYQDNLVFEFSNTLGIELSTVAPEWDLNDSSSQSGPGYEVLELTKGLSEEERRMIQDVKFHFLDSNTPFRSLQGLSLEEPSANIEAGRYVFEWEANGGTTRSIILWSTNIRTDSNTRGKTLTESGVRLFYHEVGHALSWAGAPNMNRLSEPLMAFQRLLRSGVELPSSSMLKQIRSRYGGQRNRLLEEEFAECYSMWKVDAKSVPLEMAGFFGARFDPSLNHTYQNSDVREQEP